MTNKNSTRNLSVAKKNNLMEKFGQALKNQTRKRSKEGSQYFGNFKENQSIASPTLKKTMNINSESLKSKIRKVGSIYSRDSEKQNDNKQMGTTKSKTSIVKSTRSSRDVTPTRIIPQKSNFIQKEKSSNFKIFYEVIIPAAKKFRELTFLERTGEQLYLINKVIKRNSDVYDSIRKYADFAQ